MDRAIALFSPAVKLKKALTEHALLFNHCHVGSAQCCPLC